MSAPMMSLVSALGDDIASQWLQLSAEADSEACHGGNP